VKIGPSNIRLGVVDDIEDGIDESASKESTLGTRLASSGGNGKQAKGVNVSEGSSNCKLWDNDVCSEADVFCKIGLSDELGGI
jgi:hypothetical protein